MGLEVEQLTGGISLEDSMSEAMELVASNVEHAAHKIEEAFGSIGVAVGLVTTAIGIAVGAITTLGVKGSTLQGVEDAFDTLAEKAGTTGEALRHSLSDGVKGTIDEMTLMKDTMRLMQSGMKLTTDQAELMGTASRALGKAMGTDAAGGLSAMTMALTTGQTRMIQRQIGLVDVKKGEEEFAKSLGVTVSQLNAEGILEGKRIAIFDKLRSYTEAIGNSQLSFKEKIKQAEVSVEEWFAALERGVANSPNVNKALDAILESLRQAFGGESQSLLETFLGWINRFADVAAVWGPKIIDVFVGIKDAMFTSVQYAISTYNAIPDWFFTAAAAAVKAGAAILAASVVLSAFGTAATAATTISLFSAAANGAFISTSKLGDALLYLRQSWIVLQVIGTEAVAAVVGEATGLEAVGLVLGAIATGPLAVFLAALALLAAGAAGVYQLKIAFDNLDASWASGKSMWEFLTAKQDDTFLRRWLGLTTVFEDTRIAAQGLGIEAESMSSYVDGAGISAQSMSEYVDTLGNSIDTATDAAGRFNAEPLILPGASEIAETKGFFASINLSLNDLNTIIRGFVGDALKGLVDGIVAVFKTMGDAFIGIIDKILWGIKSLISLMPGLGPLAKMFDGLSVSAGGLGNKIDAAREALHSLAEGYKELHPELNLSSTHPIVYGSGLPSDTSEHGGGHGEGAGDVDPSKYLKTDKLTAAQKAYNEALRDYNDHAGKDYLSVLNQVGNAMYEGVAADLKRGVSAHNLSLIYGVNVKVIDEIRTAEASWHKETLAFTDSMTGMTNAFQGVPWDGTIEGALKLGASIKDIAGYFFGVGKEGVQAVTAIDIEWKTRIKMWSLENAKASVDDFVKSLKGLGEAKPFDLAGQQEKAFRDSHVGMLAEQEAFNAQVEQSAKDATAAQYASSAEGLKALGASATGILAVEKSNADFAMQQALTTSDYKTALIWKTVADEKKAYADLYPGLLDQQAAYNAQVEAGAQAHVEALKQNDKAIKDNSAATLQQQAAFDKKTYDTMAAAVVGTYGPAVLLMYKEIADASARTATGANVDSQALEANTIEHLQSIADKAKNTYEMMLADPQHYSEGTIQYFKEIAIAASADMNKVSSSTLNALTLMADGFTQMAQAAGGSFGSIMASAGKMFAALKLASQAQNQIGGVANADGTFTSMNTKAGVASGLLSSNSTKTQKATSAVASGAAVAQGAMDVWSATSSHKTAAGNALGGMMAGAQAGAAFGPYGIAIGAAAGLIVGLVRGKPAWAKAADEVGKDFGVKISDALAKQIADSAKTDYGGSRQAAEIGALSDIIKEAGGLTDKNVAQMTDRFHDVFSMIETHQMTIAQGAKVIQDNFAEFAKAGTDSLGFLSDKLKDVIRLDRLMGTNTQAVTDYLKQQGDAAISASNAIMTELDDQLGGWQQNKDIMTQLDKGWQDFAAKAGDGINAWNAYWKSGPGSNAQLYADALDKQSEAAKGAEHELSNLGIIAVSTFAAAVAAGKPYAEALSAAGSGITKLADAYSALGLPIDNLALKSLIQQNAMYQGNQNLITAVGGLGDAFVAMSNMGLLNVDTFHALEETGAQMYTRLQAAAAAAGGGTREALLPMQDYLHKAAKAADELGIPLDDNTQMLIDQSKELGIWKTAGIDPLLKAMDTLAEKMQRVVDILSGVVFPPAPDYSGTGLPSPPTPPPGTPTGGAPGTDVGGGRTNAGRSVAAGSSIPVGGGAGSDLTYAGGGSSYMVAPTSRTTDQSAATTRDHTFIIEIDGRQIAEAVVPELPGAIQRVGLGR